MDNITVQVKLNRILREKGKAIVKAKGFHFVLHSNMYVVTSRSIVTGDAVIFFEDIDTIY